MLSTLRQKHHSAEMKQQIAGGGVTLRSTKDPRERWAILCDKIRMQTAHLGRRPMVPVSQIEELKRHFADRSGRSVELDREAFIAVMSTALASRNFSRKELLDWFADMDVDLSNGISWEEFTSFMISSATSFGEENIRAKEFLPDNGVAVATSNMHKDFIRRIATSAKCPYVVSGGYDGFIKLWNPNDGALVYSINNNLYSAAHEAVPAGSTCPVSPIIDVCFNARHSHCFVASADKSVNIYDSRTFALTRKFVGVMGSTLSAAFWKPNHVGCDGVPDAGARRQHATSFRTLESVDASVLVSMTESPSSMDIATPRGSEILFFSTQEGSIAAYPSLRSSVLPEVQPLSWFHGVHSEPITKVRYLAPLDALVTVSWDTSVKLTSPETGATLITLFGHSQQNAEFASNVRDTMDIGHRKSSLDFAYSEGHGLLATVGADRAVLLWNPLFTLPVSSLRGHSSPLCSVAFDEVDNLLLTMDIEGFIKTWDLRMNRCLQTFGGRGASSSASTGGSDGSGATAAAKAATGGDSTMLSMESKLDTPSAMCYSPQQHRVFCGGRNIKSWTIRRAQTHFSPTHIGHVEGVVSFSALPETSSIVTADANVLMRWSIRNGKRLALWDLNPPSADGGDMLRETGGSAAGSGGAGASLSSSLACFERDASQRRILAATVGGMVIMYNPTNGQMLRKLDLSSFVTDEPFRIAHVTNAIHSSRVIVLATPREALWVSEDPDLVTGLLPFQPFARIDSPSATTTFSAVATYPAVGQSTLSSLILGTTEGQMFVYAAGGTVDLLVSVVHPKRVRTRHSSHRKQRRAGGSVGSHRSADALGATQTSATSADGGGSSVGSGAPSLVPTSAPVEDIVYLRSLDLFVTCVGDNVLYFWDLRNGVLKLQYCTQLGQEECILSLATGEDNEPLVSYQTALNKASLKSLLANGGSGGGIPGGSAADADGTGSSPLQKMSFFDVLRSALVVNETGALALRSAVGSGEGVATTEGGNSSGSAGVGGGTRGGGGGGPNAQAKSSTKHRILISACDWGFVYVWDLSMLPPSTASVPSFIKTSIPLLCVFRAHNAPITRLSFFQDERLIVTMSTVDCYVKSFDLDGNLVGHMGQRVPYLYKRKSTFAADSYAVPLDDDSRPLPSITRTLTMTTSGGAAMVAGATALSRPQTRSLDSPMGNPTSSSFFATSLRLGVRPSSRQQLLDPQETFVTVQFPATDDGSGTLEFASPEGGATVRNWAGETLWTLPPALQVVSPHAATAAATAAAAAASGVAATRAAAARHSPPPGLRQDPGRANLRPVLAIKSRVSFRSKRESPQSTSPPAEQLEKSHRSAASPAKQQQPQGAIVEGSPSPVSGRRVLAVVSQRHRGGGGSEDSGSRTPTPHHQLLAASPPPVLGLGASLPRTPPPPPAQPASPSGWLSVTTPKTPGGVSDRRPPLAPPPLASSSTRKSLVVSPPILSSPTPIPPPLPTTSSSPSFLLTELVADGTPHTFSLSPIPELNVRGGENTDSDADEEERAPGAKDDDRTRRRGRRPREYLRSSSVPLLPAVSTEALPTAAIRVLGGSSYRYRSISALSMGVASPNAYIHHSKGGGGGGGGERAASLDGAGSSLPMSPQSASFPSSPLNVNASLGFGSVGPGYGGGDGDGRGGDGDVRITLRGGKGHLPTEKSQLSKAVRALHKMSSRLDAEQQHVDRVTRMVRDRELLKYEPVLVRSSLLECNQQMKQAVKVWPSSWTKRASSLLHTFPLQLEDIKSLWRPRSPKEKSPPRAPKPSPFHHRDF